MNSLLIICLFFLADVKQHNDCQVYNKENNSNYCREHITTPNTVTTCPSSPDALDDSFRYVLYNLNFQFSSTRYLNNSIDLLVSDFSMFFAPLHPLQ